MAELFITFLTALNNCLLCFSECLKFTSGCVGICQLLYTLYYIRFFSMCRKITVVSVLLFISARLLLAVPINEGVVAARYRL
jgi:hypothetical protein